MAYVRFSALMAALAAVIVIASPTAHAEAEGEALAPVPAPGGFGLAVWSGGNVVDLVTAAAASGCDVASASASGAAGSLVSYVPGAPDLVNRSFMTAFPGGAMPQSAVAVRCVRFAPPVPRGLALSDCTEPPPAWRTHPAVFETPPLEVELDRALAAAVAQSINQTRAAHGLASVATDASLQRAAEGYAAFLEEFDYPWRVEDGCGNEVHFMNGTPWDRASHEGFPYNPTMSIQVTEALAAAWRTAGESASAESLKPTAQTFVDLWLASTSGHRETILSEIRSHIGVGCTTSHYAADGVRTVLGICAANLGQR